MNDSIVNYFFYEGQLIDSIVRDTVSSEEKLDSTNIITNTFFQYTIQDVVPIVNQSSGFTWIIYFLLFMSFGVALIWYLIPERLTYAFSISIKPDAILLNERESPAPGVVVTFFFLMNSVITLSFLIYYVLKNVFSYDFKDWSYWKVMLYIAIIISSVYIIKMILVGLAGWVFNTYDMAKKQARMYFNSNISLGVILLPLLFILVIIPNIYLLYGILFIVLIVFLIRWIQVVSLGISITHFNFFHLILYLCTLEIIPVVVLIKIFL
jgi:uncharacterized membrane protein YhdT